MAENNQNTGSTDSPDETTKDTDYSRKMYPGRTEHNDYSWWEKMIQQTTDSEHCRMMCELNVSEAFKKNPMLRIMKGALEAAGCPLNLKRHIVCEDCNKKVQGGFDFEYNQIVLCQNVEAVRKNPDAILVHELVHMYDYCVNNVDFKNLEHLACSEIRAANLAHCSFLGAFFEGHTSPIDIKKSHQYCVKTKAAKSVATARNLDFPTAVHYVLKVFDKCYNDLEPIGRRVRRNSVESKLAEEEAKCFLITK